MRPILLVLLALAALAGVAASAVGANDALPAATSPDPTSPVGTSPVGTTPQCAVTGPAFDDRSAPLRAGVPDGKILITLTRDEVREFPRPVPTKIKSHLKKLGALLMLGPPNPDGLLEQKIPWNRDRRAKGRVGVRGERIDAPTGRFSAYINRRYGGKRFARMVPGTWKFSEPGCWRVTARAGSARVTYVVLVRRPEPGEFAPHLP